MKQVDCKPGMEHDWVEIIEEGCICIQCWTIACANCGVESFWVDKPYYFRPEYVESWKDKE